MRYYRTYSNLNYESASIESIFVLIVVSTMTMNDEIEPTKARRKEEVKVPNPVGIALKDELCNGSHSG